MEDEIDLTQVFIDLAKRWKLIAGITLVGTIIAVIIALAIPKVYKPSAEISQPSMAVVEQLQLDGITELDQDTLFKRYYRNLRSEQNFKSFVLHQGYLKSFSPESTEQNDQVREQALSELAQQLSVSILEPQAGNNENIEFPELVSVAMSAEDEGLAVQVVNQYLFFTNQQTLTQLRTEFKEIIAQRLKNIERAVALARQREKNRLQLRIEQLEAENEKKMAELALQKETTIQLAKKNRQTQIAEVKEAYKIAKQLGIENPTPIDEFTGDKNREVSTNITLNQSQELPLYLMGTRYLDSLITTLSERDNDAQFLEEINEIELEMSVVKNDPELALLKQRENVDPFIQDLPELFAKRDELKSFELNVNDISVYQTEKLASVSGKAIKPNRPLIAVLGLLLSGMVAFFAALISASITRRKEREREEADSNPA